MAPTSGRVRRSLIALAAAGGLLLSAPLAAGSTQPAQPAGSLENASDPTDSKSSWAAETLAEMSLEEKVGQLFVTYVYGESADTTDPDDVARNREFLGVDNGREAVETYGIGGVIYFAWSDNLSGPQQIAGLSNGLQEAADHASGVPLLVTTDQEHGAVTRIAEPATRFPGSMALGASGGTEDAWTAARLAGQELRAMGITMNHAPTADVNVNPDNPVIGVRSFSSNPQLAASLTGAQVEGYQEGTDGVVASAKHFPGHGNTDVDSHHGLPVITHTLEEWREIDAPPFRAAIEADTGSVMSGHLQFPELDASGDPATLSAPIMTGLLREELGYDGVVITDSLQMDGVREQYPDEEVPVRALQAGVDLLLMPPDLDGAYHAVLEAVSEGELSEERIDTSVLRILELKEQRGLAEDPYVDPDWAGEFVGAPDHREQAQELTDGTTTLVANEDDMLPWDADSMERILVTGPDAEATEELAGQVGARVDTATSHPVSSNPTEAEIVEVVSAAAGHDAVVVATSDAGSNSGQVALVEAVLTGSGTALATVSLDVPYDIAAYPDVSAHLALYSAVPVSLESAARALFGESDPSGTLPVTVPAAGDDEVLYPIGHGLSYGIGDSGVGQGES